MSMTVSIGALTMSLGSFALKYTFQVPASSILQWLGERFTDHSQTLPKALAKANDRAWQVVGVAIAGRGWFGRVKELLGRDGDFQSMRKQISAFLDNIPTGLESAPEGLRNARI